MDEEYHSNDQSARLQVLNAFRHHCSFHSARAATDPETRRCSTPFGIIVRSTPKSSPAAHHLPSAQRLSASLFVPRRWRQDRRPCRVCAQRLSASLFVPRRGYHRAPVRIDVLNAFRHHCSFHAPSATPSDLAAPSAQRLSASLFVPHGPQRRADRQSHVLNAFRHHCSFHRPPLVQRTLMHVCAQRLSASLFVPREVVAKADGRLGGAQRLSASLFVPRARDRRPLHQPGVLNAFRHHCSFHSSLTGSTDGRFPCSTPFGIIVRSTQPV